MMDGPTPSLLARRAIGTGEEENLPRELAREWILWLGEMDCEAVGSTRRVSLWPRRPRSWSVIEEGPPTSIRGLSMSKASRFSLDKADEGG